MIALASMNGLGAIGIRNYVITYQRLSFKMIMMSLAYQIWMPQLEAVGKEREWWGWQNRGGDYPPIWESYKQH